MLKGIRNLDEKIQPNAEDEVNKLKDKLNLTDAEYFNVYGKNRSETWEEIEIKYVDPMKLILKAKKEKIIMPKPSKKQQVLEMIKEGKTNKEIRKAINCSRMLIWRCRKDITQEIV